MLGIVDDQPATAKHSLLPADEANNVPSARRSYVFLVGKARRTLPNRPLLKALPLRRSCFKWQRISSSDQNDLGLSRNFLMVLTTHFSMNATSFSVLEDLIFKAEPRSLSASHNVARNRYVRVASPPPYSRLTRPSSRPSLLSFTSPISILLGAHVILDQILTVMVDGAASFRMPIS